MGINYKDMTPEQKREYGFIKWSEAKVIAPTQKVGEANGEMRVRQTS